MGQLKGPVETITTNTQGDEGRGNKRGTRLKLITEKSDKGNKQNGKIKQEINQQVEHHRDLTQKAEHEGKCNIQN